MSRQADLDPQLEIEEALKYFSEGAFPDSEIIVGLVGAIGAGLHKVVADLKVVLEAYDYRTMEIRVSQDVIPMLVQVQTLPSNDEYARISSLMDAGNEARRQYGNNGVLGLGVSALMQATRDHAHAAPLSRRRCAYVINSLKHPKEVETLRRIYGPGFFLMGVHADFKRRKDYLTEEKRIDPPKCVELMERDEKESGERSGQRTRDTFHLSDFFLHLDESEDRRRNSIRRMGKLLFGCPYTTPTFDEYAMFLAFSASLRSADLSRQVGAVVANGDEIIATGANDCPRAGGGLYWPRRGEDGKVVDEPHGRDFARGEDSNDRAKCELIADVALRLSEISNVSMSALSQAIRRSRLDDITEYGRVVHAEMEALLSCARNGLSTRGTTMYCTTFPCHNCAKHIIAAGVERVVYVEPYPKSKALAFHDDASYLGFFDRTKKGVAFEPFFGVGPRRFFDLFSMNQEAGYALRRKDRDGGNAVAWREEDGVLRTAMVPWSYYQREELAARSLEGERHVEE